MVVEGHKTFHTSECDFCSIDVTESITEPLSDKSKEFYKSIAEMIVDSYQS
ncbi:hypothetical protein [Bacillus sp. FJAT-45350]|uniref:hypothetical protein n=1 Tax=Bacillus sp. FJAT-45350 TaxID=2011014 RepID=UPI0015C7CD86|nr:hypothetical protein [Bacillus sp. FJAT-45350]